MSRSTDVATVGPVCPAAVTLTLDIMSDTDWLFTATWSPNVTYLQATFWALIPLEAPVQFDAVANVTSPTQSTLDPSTIGSSGDTISFWVVLSGADACPDLTSNVIDTIIP